MINPQYLQFCEDLWRSWLAGNLVTSQRVSSIFQLDHAPEPFLRFDCGTSPLFLLLTNPGVGMSHQRRENILGGQSCVDADLSYNEVSLILASFYRAHLSAGGARTRNNAIERLASLLRKDCVVQFESIPFHSPALPNKDAIPKLVAETPMLSEYARLLAATIQQVPTIALAAVATNRPISNSSVANKPWLAWQASLMGVEPDSLELTPLVRKNGKITSALLSQARVEGVSGFVLTMGGNNFPAQSGLEILAGALSRGAPA